MTLALLGIITVQGYWLNSAIKLKEQQFQESVMHAMNVTAQKFERLQKNAQFNQKNDNNQGQLLSITGSSNERDSLNRTRSFSVEWAEESVFETADGKIITTTTRTLKDAEGNIVQRARNTHKAGTKFGQNNGQVLQSLIEDISTFGFPAAVNDKIDPYLLNKLIKGELKNHGISTKFHLGIFSDNKLVLKEQGISADELIASPYSMQLFPGDFYFNNSYFNLLFPKERGFLFKSVSWVIILSFVFLLTIVIAFWITLKTIIDQKKLAVIKSDFINNMTHELKTPISTISLACEVLNDKDIPKSETRLEHYVNVIGSENKRLGTLVENVLQSAVLDKGDFKLNLHEIDAHQIIQQVATRSKVRVETQNGKITTALNAEEFYIIADKVHFTNVVSNLIDNAIKYTPNNPTIHIKTRNVNKGIVVEVTDNGIGISKEHQQKVFDKLFRVPTGNVHDVKGFGLGLSYVKAVVEKHIGSIKVSSQLGKGSTFCVHFPLNPKNDE